MKIVTSGSGFIDIDAYASCIAYANLLKLEGIEARAVSTAKQNESITKSLLNLEARLYDYKESYGDDYIVIDVSNREFFDEIVEENKIEEIIDHHIGFEAYWKEKLGEKSKIEFIGAAATLIIEIYENKKLLDKMSKDIAYLLMAAIIDNTLNFKAKISTNRDRKAYQKLQKITKDDGTYAKKYFMECQSQIEASLEEAIINDTKIDKINEKLPKVFGQLTVWDKDAILEKYPIIKNTLEKIDQEWMMNLICLKEGKSYIIAENLVVKENLENILGGRFKNDIMTLKEVWLRKEIIKKAI